MFSFDSPVFKFLFLVFDVLLVSLLWLLTSLPIVTAGASTTAAYYVIMRRVSDRENSIIKDYFSAFKSNFINTTLAFLAIAALLFVIWLNFVYTSVTGPLSPVVYGLQILFAIQLVFLLIHVFPLASRFEMKFTELIRSAIVMANKHLITTLAHILLLYILILLCQQLLMLYFLAFGPYCWVSSYMMINIYRKYKPELDKNEEEE